MMRDIGAILVLAVSLVALPGCKKSQESQAPSRSEASPAPAAAAQPVAVVGLTLGNQVGPDKKVTGETKTFAPGDTIYASVDTHGAAPAAALAARWTFQDGQTVHEETQALTLSGPATTEFHIAKPDGWPKGNYKVEILLDGVPVQSADFTVG
jgi:hypothetical protein